MAKAKIREELKEANKRLRKMKGWEFLDLASQ